MAEISVIVTVYNREKYLKQCLDSLKNQTYTDFEAIIIDDGSTDSSPEIEKTYTEDKRFNLILSEHIGFPAAKNLGLAKATGKYVIFLDSDDWAYPQWLEYLHKAIDMTGADISTCYYDEFIEGKAEPKAEPKPEDYAKAPFTIVEYKYLKMNLIYNRFCSSYLWNKLVKKELYDGIVFPDQPSITDISEIYKIFDKAQYVVQVPLNLIHYRRHAASMGGLAEDKDVDYFVFRAKVLEDSASFVWNNYPQSRFVTQLMLYSELKKTQELIGKLNYKKYIDRPFFQMALSTKVDKVISKQ